MIFIVGLGGRVVFTVRVIRGFLRGLVRGLGFLGCRWCQRYARHSRCTLELTGVQDVMENTGHVVYRGDESNGKNKLTKEGVTRSLSPEQRKSGSATKTSVMAHQAASHQQRAVTPEGGYISGPNNDKSKSPRS